MAISEETGGGRKVREGKGRNATPWIVAARGILQARILELVAISFSRVSF